jgi:type VI protein secretion system component VasF
VLTRFFPLIHSARSLASDAALPLSEISARLYELAREEQDSPVPARADPDGEKPAPGLPAERPDLSRCRLAVYAWADEILLTSARPDASLWAAYSLQHTFCQTSAAGTLFFQTLDELLDALLPLTGEAAEAGEEFVLPARLEAAARLSREENFARRELDVFALCLLLGFCGRYFEMPRQREKLREAARLILRGSEGAKAPSPNRRVWRHQELPYAMEWIFYAILPLIATLLFGLYCADLLVEVPRIGFRGQSSEDSDLRRQKTEGLAALRAGMDEKPGGGSEDRGLRRQGSEDSDLRRQGSEDSDLRRRRGMDEKNP